VVVTTQAPVWHRLRTGASTGASAVVPPVLTSKLRCHPPFLLCGRRHAPDHAVCWTGALPVAYSVFTGLFCTQSLVFNKAIMVIFRLELSEGHQVGRTGMWACKVLCVISVSERLSMNQV